MLIMKKFWNKIAAVLLSIILILSVVASVGAAENPSEGTTASNTTSGYRPYGYTDSEKPENGHIYYIRNKRSGKYLTTSGIEDGSVITQETYTGQANQKWVFENLTGKICKLLTASSEKPMAVCVTPSNDINGTYVDLRSPSESEGAVFTYTRNADKNSFRFSTASSHYTKVLAVQNALGANGARIIQYTYGVNNNDEWYFETSIDDYSAYDPQHISTSIDSDTWYVKNKNSGMYLGLDEDNVNVVQTHFLGLDSQKWKFVRQTDGTYKLVNKASGEQNVLGIEGNSAANNANVRMQVNSDGNTGRFKMERNSDGQSYRFLTQQTNFNKCITVKNAGITHGANIIQYTYNAGQNDCWILEKDRPVMQIESGKCYYLKNRRSGLYLGTTLKNTRPGTQIVQQALNPETAMQRWRIINTAEGIKIVSDVNSDSELALSVQSGSAANGTNIILNQYDAQDNGMQFKIVQNSDGYTYRLLTKNSAYEKCVTVYLASNTENAKIIQYNYNDGFNDAWILEPAIQMHVYYDNHYLSDNAITDGEYYIVNKNSGLYLDVYGGYNTDGTNIIQWTGNQGKGQKWRFVSAGNGTFKVVTSLGNSTRGLCVNPANNTNYANIELKTYDNSSGMRFKMLRTNDDVISYRIVSECSNFTKALAVYFAGTEPGDDIIQYDYRASGNDEWYLKRVSRSTEQIVVEENAETYIVDNLKAYWKEIAEGIYDRANIHLLTSYEKVYSPVDECATGNNGSCPHEAKHKEWADILGWINNYNQTKYPRTCAALHYGAPNSSGIRGGLGYVVGHAFLINYTQSGGLYSNVGVMLHELTHNFKVYHHIDELPGGASYNGIWVCCQGGLPEVDICTQKPDYWCDSCLRKLIFFSSSHAG